MMEEPTLNEATMLNQILANKTIKPGGMVVLGQTKEPPLFIDLANVEPFKLPKSMRGVETRKSFTNRASRITKVMWIMDLTSGVRVLRYPLPNLIKVLHNNRIQNEERISNQEGLVPSNVNTLWRLDATYELENDQEVFYEAVLRKYER